MDEGVDSGNVLYKISIEIGKDADIVDLNDHVNKAAYQGTMELLKMFASQPRFEGSQQDQSVSNYWRKRTVHDVILDLRLPAEQIVRIVRSYTLPYPCAKLVFKQHIIRIVEAVINSGAYSREELLRQEPGKVFGASGRVIKVKAGDELVDLTSIEPLPEELVKSKYIHPSTKYFCEWPQLSVQLSKE
jgi:methionyl-tRNA formyltransferase